MLDEDELQRRELARLLATATDEDRREVIRKAMSALDTHERTVSPDRFNHALNPSVHASVYLGHNMPFESMGSSRLRPVSARRRPSVPNLLDAIPEQHSNKNNANKDEEMVLPYDDIAEVITSCSDARFRAKNIFKSLHSNNLSSGSPSHLSLQHNNSSGQLVSSPKNGNASFPHRRSPFSLRKEKDKDRLGGCWISTGLVPHFLIITFYEKWNLRKIEVKGISIEKMAVHINYSASSAFSSAKLLAMNRSTADETKFYIDLTSRSHNSSGNDLRQQEDTEGVSGIGITLVVQKVSNMFCLISQIKIFASPNS